MKKRKKQKGFTLMEITVTIIIVGILAAIVLPRYTIFMERNRATEIEQLLSSLYSAQKVYAIENNGAFYCGNNYNANFDVQITDPGYTFLTDCSGGAGTFNMTIFKAGPTYKLYVNEDADIMCENQGANTMCGKFGYPTYAP